MPEIKGLQDFYDPTKAFQAALTMQQIGLHQQSIAQNQQAVDQQGKNLEIDNLQKALQTTDPMQSYPIQKQINDRLGLPTPPVNDYYTNLPYARRVRGAQNIGEAAGITTNNDTASLIEHSPAAQSQITSAIAMNSLQKEKAERMDMANQEHQALVAKVKPEMQALNTLSIVTARGLEKATPVMRQLQPIEEKYQKDIKRLGMAGAQKAKAEAIKTNPALAQFEDSRTQAQTTLQTGLDALHQQEDALTAHLRGVTLGTDVLKEGESLETLQGNLAALGHQIDYTNAHLNMAKSPTPGNLQAVQALKSNMDTRLLTLHQTKQQSEEGLSIRRDAQYESAQEHRLTRERIDNIGKAQVAWQKAGGVMEDAYKYAEKFGVHVDEVKASAKDPNRPGIEIKMPGTTEEAGKFSMINNAVKSVDAVSAAITKPDGTIDREKVFSANLNIPFTEGRNINSMMEDAVSAKLRAETGAAANAEEVRSILRRFDISSFDKDEVIKNKLSRLRRFLDETRVIRDSSGKIRETAAKGEQGSVQSAGHPKVMNESDYSALATGSTYIAPDGTTRTKR